MKTISEWLKTLPEGYRELALTNFEKALMVPMPPFKYYNFLHGAIYNGFNWESTPEGAKFWKKVYEHFAYGSTLPPLPETHHSKEEEVSVEEVGL